MEYISTVIDVRKIPLIDKSYEMSCEFKNYFLGNKMMQFINSLTVDSSLHQSQLAVNWMIMMMGEDFICKFPLCHLVVVNK